LVTGAGHDLTPDACAPGSAQANDTVTSVLLHPSTFAAGLRLALIVGCV
jgi:hypothetical protein